MMRRRLRAVMGARAGHVPAMLAAAAPLPAGLDAALPVLEVPSSRPNTLDMPQPRVTPTGLDLPLKGAREALSTPPARLCLRRAELCLREARDTDCTQPQPSIPNKPIII